MVSNHLGDQQERGCEVANDEVRPNIRSVADVHIQVVVERDGESDAEAQPMAVQQVPIDRRNHVSARMCPATAASRAQYRVSARGTCVHHFAAHANRDNTQQVLCFVIFTDRKTSGSLPERGFRPVIVTNFY